MEHDNFVSLSSLYIMRETRMHLKKSLGQHFLINEDRCIDIVELLPKEKPLNVLEVGPGGGAITKYILKIPGINYRAIEADHQKVKFLQKQFPAYKDDFILGSFLEMEKPFDEPFVVIGNFPYNISSQIMFKVLEWVPDVSHMIGMFQKEVGKRIVANHGTKDYGILSVLTDLHFDREYHFDVPPEDFRPAPKVNSGVIRLDFIGNRFELENEAGFKKFVKVAFSQRRKTLRNVLKSHFDAEVLNDEFFNKRIEHVSIQELVNLYKSKYES